MKVLVKSYRIPMVLLIMGPIVMIASSLSVAERYVGELHTIGWLFIILGLLGWLLPEISRTMRKSAARRSTYAQQPTAPPRRTRPY